MAESHENVRREKKEAVASAFGRSGLSMPSGSRRRRLPVARVRRRVGLEDGGEAEDELGAEGGEADDVGRRERLGAVLDQRDDARARRLDAEERDAQVEHPPQPDGAAGVARASSR